MLDCNLAVYLLLILSLPEDALHGRQKLLTQADGRDLARASCLEEDNLEAYCVSLQEATTYSSSKHVFANFNKRNFVETLLEAWGNNAGLSNREDKAKSRFVKKFTQIILDYF